jgi:hypothetical protein
MVNSGLIPGLIVMMMMMIVVVVTALYDHY